MPSHHIVPEDAPQQISRGIRLHIRDYLKTNPSSLPIFLQIQDQLKWPLFNKQRIIDCFMLFDEDPLATWENLEHDPKELVKNFTKSTKLNKLVAIWQKSIRRTYQTDFKFLDSHYALQFFYSYFDSVLLILLLDNWTGEQKEIPFGTDSLLSFLNERHLNADCIDVVDSNYIIIHRQLYLANRNEFVLHLLSIDKENAKLNFLSSTQHRGKFQRFIFDCTNRHRFLVSICNTRNVILWPGRIENDSIVVEEGRSLAISSDEKYEQLDGDMLHTMCTTYEDIENPIGRWSHELRLYQLGENERELPFFSVCNLEVWTATLHIKHVYNHWTSTKCYFFGPSRTSKYLALVVLDLNTQEFTHYTYDFQWSDQIVDFHVEEEKNLLTICLDYEDDYVYGVFQLRLDPTKNQTSLKEITAFAIRQHALYCKCDIRNKVPNDVKDLVPRERTETHPVPLEERFPLYSMWEYIQRLFLVIKLLLTA